MDNQSNQQRDRLRFRVGAFDYLVINDGAVRGAAEMLFVNAPAPQLATALRAHGLAPDHLPSTWSCQRKW